MSSYDFILDSMIYSFSSVTSFKTCPFMFKLTYIQYEERGKNFYSDFGLLMHNVLEMFFTDKLEVIELARYYEENYPIQVTSPQPPYPAGIADRYYQQGLEFFENFDFDKSKYEIISIEDKINATHNDASLVIKPDLVLKEKDSGKTILMDYKTSDPFKNGKRDQKKIDEYKKQMYLYAYFINHTTEVKIDRIKLWFVRVNKFEEFDYVEEDAGDVVNWFYDGILNIRLEEEFPPCDVNKNKFFCQMLCSVSDFCPYKP